MVHKKKKRRWRNLRRLSAMKVEENAWVPFGANQRPFAVVKAQGGDMRTLPEIANVEKAASSLAEAVKVMKAGNLDEAAQSKLLTGFDSVADLIMPPVDLPEDVSEKTLKEAVQGVLKRMSQLVTQAQSSDYALADQLDQVVLEVKKVNEMISKLGEDAPAAAPPAAAAAAPAVQDTPAPAPAPEPAPAPAPAPAVAAAAAAPAPTPEPAPAVAPTPEPAPAAAAAPATQDTPPAAPADATPAPTVASGDAAAVTPAPEPAPAAAAAAPDASASDPLEAKVDKLTTLVTKMAEIMTQGGQPQLPNLASSVAPAAPPAPAGKVDKTVNVLTAEEMFDMSLSPDLDKIDTF
jgi:hypothetical protein